MKPSFTVQSLTDFCNSSLISHIGIEFLEINQDFIRARMPVDHRTIQPFGTPNGGACVVLAETLGSIAGYTRLDSPDQYCVGLQVNANHIKSVRHGFVYGKATPFHIGLRTQVWDIQITDEQEEMVSICRLTLAVADKK